MPRHIARYPSFSDWVVVCVPLGSLAVETDDGYERGVEIIGPAESGKAEQMRVRFPDGTEDDWDEDEFEPRNPEPEPEPEPQLEPEPVASKAAFEVEEKSLDKKTRKKLEKLRKKEAKEAEKQRKLELKQKKKGRR